MFQSPQVIWMSDGSVHLPVVIRFEVYEDCGRSVSPITTRDENARRSQDKRRTSREKTRLLLTIEKRLQAYKRAVVFAHLKRGDHTAKRAHFSPPCLSPTPRLSLQGKGESLEAQKWRAIRWLWSTKYSSNHASPQAKKLKDQVKASVNLGELTCLHDSVPILQPKSISEAHAQKLKKLVNSNGGAELWVWIDR